MENLEKLREIEFTQRENRLKQAVPQKLKYTKQKKELLHITYVMTWTGICGGSKIILEHSNRLVELGHTVNIISHFPKPNWFPLSEKVNFIQVPWEEILGNGIPPSDVIVATYWREIYECVEQKIAPVIYFEQGDFHLFDLEKLTDRQFNYIKKQLETIKFVYTVSSFAQEKLKEIYNKDSDVIPNAVNDKVFYYEPHKENNKKTITVIGAEEAKFKRIENILKAIEIVKQHGYDIDIKWITPTEPTKNEIEAIVNPPQKVIGDTLRNTDIYVCASMYESFCLPVLEAMTCGAAVITTNNGGNMDFVEDNKNALVIEKDSIEDIVSKTELLLNNEKLRSTIANNGVEKAKEYSWNITIDKIVKYYQEIAKYEIEN